MESHHFGAIDTTSTRPGRSVPSRLFEASAEKQQWLTKVKRNGRNLQHAPEHLQKDQEVVTAAVRQDGRALQFASKELKSNQDVASRLR